MSKIRAAAYEFSRPIQLYDRGLLARVVRYSVRFTAVWRGLLGTISCNTSIRKPTQSGVIIPALLIASLNINKASRSSLHTFSNCCMRFSIAENTGFGFILHLYGTTRRYFSLRHWLHTADRPLNFTTFSGLRQVLHRLTLASCFLRRAHSAGLMPSIAPAKLFIKLYQRIKRYRANYDNVKRGKFDHLCLATCATISAALRDVQPQIGQNNSAAWRRV